MHVICRLTDIGFHPIGKWVLNNDKLCNTIKDTTPSSFLYAFVVNGEVKYIGKSRQTIKERFNGYINPGKSQTTNINNNKNIKAQLRQGKDVEIYTLVDNKICQRGEFNVSLSAGLEDDLIKQINPPWNM